MALVNTLNGWESMRAAEATGMGIRDLNIKAGSFEVWRTLHSIQGE